MSAHRFVIRGGEVYRGGARLLMVDEKVWVTTSRVEGMKTSELSKTG